MIKLRLRTFAVAIFIAVGNFFLIQLMSGSTVMGRTLVPGLADFSPTHNRGVSFGLLTPDGATGLHLLIALLIAISLFVAVMAWRASTVLASIGYAWILGGALGNLSDRLLNDGAVFDFLALHLGRIPLFVCNFADIAITMGVILLFADHLLMHKGARDSAE